MVDIGLYAGYILIILCVILAIGFYVAQLIGDSKLLVRTLIGLGIGLTVFFIGYGIADGESEVTTEGIAKLVGAGIISMYIFLVIAIVGIIYTEISKMIK